MQLSDIRINDWVFINGEPQQAVGIQTLGGERIVALRLFMSDAKFYKPEEAEPIPLSDELLENIDVIRVLPQGASNIKRYGFHYKDGKGFFENEQKLTIWGHPDGIFEFAAKKTTGDGSRAIYGVINSFNDLQHILSDIGVKAEYERAITKLTKKDNETEH